MSFKPGRVSGNLNSVLEIFLTKSFQSEITIASSCHGRHQDVGSVRVAKTPLKIKKFTKGLKDNT